MDTLVKEGSAQWISNSESGNPDTVPPAITLEQNIKAMTCLRNANALARSDGRAMTDDDISHAAKALHREFTAIIERSMKLVASGKVISRYRIPGAAASPTKYNIFRVSGEDETHKTFRSALRAAGWSE
ncbi:MAG: hypothetical protein M1429_03245 [Patescibacteria group bacterium]|nr:hypothetical protein [Patescibacteria group bacterium]